MYSLLVVLKLISKLDFIKKFLNLRLGYLFVRLRFLGFNESHNLQFGGHSVDSALSEYTGFSIRWKVRRQEGGTV